MNNVSFGTSNMSVLYDSHNVKKSSVSEVIESAPKVEINVVEIKNKLDELIEMINKSGNRNKDLNDSMVSLLDAKKSLNRIK